MLISFVVLEKIKNSLQRLKNQNILSNFNIDLTMNQLARITIASDRIKNISDLADEDTIFNEIDCYNISFDFLTEENGLDEDYAYLFKENSINFGLRRSLDNLIDPSDDEIHNQTPVVTFFSYKGGVGRTTSLALFCGYYASFGKKVFVVDCDFEAPGLINFFNISQFNNPKNGIVEYLIDSKFCTDLKLSDKYIYEVPSVFTGEGKVHLMPAGNIFGDEKKYYLEGLSRLDLQGRDSFTTDITNLIININKEYSPDVIIFDSRTGFNNVFGSLSEISDLVIALSGDDHQNEAGIEFLLERFSEIKDNKKLIMILSIISSSITKRYERFNKKILSYCEAYPDFNVPTFIFQRESMLELVGTEFEDIEDTKHFMSHSGSNSYSKFFEFLSEELKSITETEFKVPVAECVEVEENIKCNESADLVIQKLSSSLPDPYAENIKYDDSFFQKDFYIRQCMQDLFLPEYKILLGGKGTGKTAFYKALQNDIFFNLLVKRAEKEHLKFKVIHAIGDYNSSAGSYFELSSHFSSYLDDDSKIRKFWVIYLWLAVCRSGVIEPDDNYFEVKNDNATFLKFKAIIDSEELYTVVENSLEKAESSLRHSDSRLIVTFDQLDFVVIPKDWNRGISPLIRLCVSNNWERIQPKLFVRRDLFSKLGNLTNKNALEKQTINLEWSHEEMYAFLFKVVFAYARDEFLEFLGKYKSEDFIKNQIVKRLNKRNNFNQLPADEYILRPLTEVFFGESRDSWNNAYDELYTNIKNADQTISLRPFLDLIKLAINEQIRDDNKLRGSSVLSIQYCMYKSVRSQAVDKHFNDLANEAGNELIRLFVEDIRNSAVPDRLKCSSLLQNDFEELVECVKDNHDVLKTLPVTHFEEMLVLNGIIFVTYISGGRKKYSFAFLYKYYLGLRSPRKLRKPRV
ncbi:AAA family ATPase [Klebsiella quasipneumoniae]|uniref:KGGVGR-motif variant AAA ATPase n=1 Tax=Klebsiella pneumoniae complex TaxID=3390273 RepID=UPI001C64C40E|nr:MULTISPECIES: AAA family ATPase [Klebsiella]EIY5007553.1 AAA family ATPase [Klebsiella variicola]MCJ7353957.1 AAA family ATPase [Klebsiella quasipneumoniae]